MSRSQSLSINYWPREVGWETLPRADASRLFSGFHSKFVGAPHILAVVYLLKHRIFRILDLVTWSCYTEPALQSPDPPFWDRISYGSDWYLVYCIAKDLDSWSSCLHLPSAAITGECHHAEPWNFFKGQKLGWPKCCNPSTLELRQGDWHIFAATAGYHLKFSINK